MRYKPNAWTDCTSLSFGARSHSHTRLRRNVTMSHAFRAADVFQFIRMTEEYRKKKNYIVKYNMSPALNRL